MFYSQHGQDEWVLKKTNYKKNGFFVDIGAHEGIWISNTYILESEYDWKGICVEANNRSFTNLCKNRKCTCLNEVVFDKEEIVSFQIGDKNDAGCGIVLHDTDCFNENTKYFTGEERIDVKTTTLLNILKNNNSPNVIDYLSVDVEGAEHYVITEKLFDYYKFLTMTIERPKDILLKRLSNYGYIIDYYGINDIHFIHETLR